MRNSLTWELSIPRQTRYRMLRPLSPGTFVTVDYHGPGKVVKDHRNGSVLIESQSKTTSERRREEVEEA